MKHGNKKQSATQIVKEIKRSIHRTFSADRNNKTSLLILTFGTFMVTTAVSQTVIVDGHAFPGI